jgi:valyl-tRNA synthetase
MMIQAGATIPLILIGVSAETDARAGRWAEVIKRLARLSSIAVSPNVPEGAVQLVVRGETVALPLKGVIDFAFEQARLEKEMARAAADIARIDAKLGNPNFVSRAAEEVVEQERERREAADARRLKIVEALERLKGVA